MVVSVCELAAAADGLAERLREPGVELLISVDGQVRARLDPAADLDLSALFDDLGDLDAALTPGTVVFHRGRLVGVLAALDVAAGSGVSAARAAELVAATRAYVTVHPDASVADLLVFIAAWHPSR